MCELSGIIISVIRGHVEQLVFFNDISLLFSVLWPVDREQDAKENKITMGSNALRSLLVVFIAVKFTDIDAEPKSSLC